jgi:putative endonuclease
VCPETVRSDVAAKTLPGTGKSRAAAARRNYRCRGGEIDLVMLEGSTLVLVEVRLRTAGGFGGAAASVGPRKQRRFILAARHLMVTRPEYRKLQARFDVVALDAGARPGETRIDWIRDAFRIGK